MLKKKIFFLRDLVWLATQLTCVIHCYRNFFLYTKAFFLIYYNSLKTKVLFTQCNNGNGKLFAFLCFHFLSNEQCHKANVYQLTYLLQIIKLMELVWIR